MRFNPPANLRSGGILWYINNLNLLKMKHTTETSQIRIPLPIDINNQLLTCGRWKAKMIDPEHVPYFGLGFRPDIARSQEPSTETEITLTFHGEDSTKVRAALQDLFLSLT